MSRPADWQPLAAADPTPGDPAEVARLGRRYLEVAEEIQQQAAALRRLATADYWTAEAADTFRDKAGDAADGLAKTHDRYHAAGSALSAWAPDLQDAQDAAGRLLVQAQSLQDQLDAARYQTVAPAPGDATAAQTAAAAQAAHSHQAQIAELEDRIAALQHQLGQVSDERDHAAAAAANAINDASERDGLKDSWWDQFKEWVDDHCDILNLVEKTLSWVSTIVCVLTLFFPVLAPLALGLLALQTLTAATLAAAGDGSWITVALDATATATMGAGELLGAGLGAGTDTATEVETASDTVRLAARTDELHSVLDPIAQSSRTSAVLGTTSAEGKAVDVLAGGVRDLSPAQRALAGPGDVLAKLPDEHAETTALKAAADAGLTPQAITTSWNICPECQTALEESGATLAGPRTAVWLRGGW